MHPESMGEMARLRAQEIAREATARHRHSIPRPAFRSAGFLTTVSLRHATRHAVRQTTGTRRVDAGIRARVGLFLIRIGMRFVDPVTQLRGAGHHR
ncbi:hypothetical protein BH23ACT9_BH23ACT9_11860 [soil metagenome]